MKGFVLQTQLCQYEWWRSLTNDFAKGCSLFVFLHGEKAHVSMELMGNGVKGGPGDMGRSWSTKSRGYEGISNP